MYVPYTHTRARTCVCVCYVLCARVNTRTLRRTDKRHYRVSCDSAKKFPYSGGATGGGSDRFVSAIRRRRSSALAPSKNIGVVARANGANERESMFLFLFDDATHATTTLFKTRVQRYTVVRCARVAENALNPLGKNRSDDIHTRVFCHLYFFWLLSSDERKCVVQTRMKDNLEEFISIKDEI